MNIPAQPVFKIPDGKTLVQIAHSHSRDSDGFERTAQWLKNLFETNNIYTRHFNIDTEKFRGPFEKAAVSIK